MIEIPVSWGELLDKITILEIKALRIAEPEKRAHVERELSLLRERRPGQGALGQAGRLERELKAVNLELWDIEDEIRVLEREQDFGPDFIDLARRVYRTNDKRASLKRAINDCLGSTIREEKSYAAY